MQSEGPSADRRIICWLRNYLQLEELSSDRRPICRSKNYLMQIEDLQIKEVEYLLIEELSAGQSSIYRSADCSSIFK